MSFLAERLILGNSPPVVESIFPSLLSADPMRFGEEVSSLMQMGTRMIHLDVMDNHYVPNLTFGPGMAQKLRQCFPDLGIDVHLMTTPVDALIEQFAHAGATRLSIHPDATIHLDRSLQLIRSLGCQAGLVLNPSTSMDCLTWCVSRLDFVLVMTVNPGFGGQSLIPEVIPKIQQIHQAFPALPICVDGGVNSDNLSLLAKAGASQFIVGAGLFNSTDYQQTMTALCQSLSPLI
jgi:ribulose-phosphate 3-epimerase